MSENCYSCDEDIDLEKDKGNYLKIKFKAASGIIVQTIVCKSCYEMFWKKQERK